MATTSTNRRRGDGSVGHDRQAGSGDDLSDGAPSDATSSTATISMTPAAAVARHVEWLEFALEAATTEERWRRERLAKADKGNRAKRVGRLAEAVAEIDELTALLAGIRELQGGTAPAAAPARRRGRPPGSKNRSGPRTPASTSSTSSTAD
jgi:hypothetical protein